MFDGGNCRVILKSNVDESLNIDAKLSLVGYLRFFNIDFTLDAGVNDDLLVELCCFILCIDGLKAFDDGVDVDLLE